MNRLEKGRNEDLKNTKLIALLAFLFTDRVYLPKQKYLVPTTSPDQTILLQPLLRFAIFITNFHQSSPILTRTHLSIQANLHFKLTSPESSCLRADPLFNMTTADVRDMLDLPTDGQPRPAKKQKTVEKRPG